MPLTRPLTAAAHPMPTGVRFDLADRQKLFHCIVTQAALEKLAAKRLKMPDFEEIFLAHRNYIESVASNKYDASRVVYCPFTIKPDDLRKHSPSRLEAASAR